MTSNRIPINVSTETHDALASRKVHPRQSFDEVIIEILNKTDKEA
jgi:hypothetical protein